MRRVGLILDASAVLGYAAGRIGVVDLLASLDGAPFGVTVRSLALAVTVGDDADDLVIEPERIVTHPGFTLLLTPTDLDKLRRAYRRFFDPELTATLLCQHAHGCGTASYEPERYDIDGVAYGDILRIEDGW